MEPTNRPSLVKQLLGALGGAAVALVLYQGYKLSAPVVTAWLVAPQSQIAAERPGSASVNQDVGEYKYRRVAARAKEIYQKFAAEQGPQAAVLPQGIEVTQPQQSSSTVPFVDITKGASSASATVQAVSASSSSSLEEVFATVVNEPEAPLVSVQSAVVTQRASKLAGKKLPQSGVGTAVVAVIALGVTAVVRRRKIK